MQYFYFSVSFLIGNNNIFQWVKTVFILLDNANKVYYYNPRLCRCGGIGRHKGLKIPRWKHRTGSSPVSGTKKGRCFAPAKWLSFFCNVPGLNRVQKRSGPVSGTKKKRQFSAGDCRFLLYFSLLFSCSYLFSENCRFQISQIRDKREKIRSWYFIV